LCIVFMTLLSFRGISTPSLQAQGEQRRSSFFNIGRDIPRFPNFGMKVVEMADVIRRKPPQRGHSLASIHEAGPDMSSYHRASNQPQRCWRCRCGDQQSTSRSASRFERQLQPKPPALPGNTYFMSSRTKSIGFTIEYPESSRSLTTPIRL
jgi:hypothetical protein